MNQPARFLAAVLIVTVTGRSYAALPEVYSQKAGDDLASFWRMMNGNTVLPDWLKQHLGDAIKADIAAHSATQPFAKDKDLALHLASYRAALAHAKLVIVSHSQGNFYASAAYSALVSQSIEHGAATGVWRGDTCFRRSWSLHHLQRRLGNQCGFLAAYLAVPEARATIAQNVLNLESGLVPMPRTELDEDPSCSPVVLDIADPPDCAHALAGTCVDKFFGTCFDPAGNCTMSPASGIPSGSLVAIDSPTWSNGARVAMAADITNPTAPFLNMTV